MKWLLFLCTGNYYRSRFAEEYFNHFARLRRLDWRADSRGLSPDMGGLDNVGTISRNALRELERLGVVPNKHTRSPRSLAADELAEFDRIIAISRIEHEPMVAAALAAEVARFEYWEVGDIHLEAPPEACARLARLIDAVLDECGGGR